MTISSQVITALRWTAAARFAAQIGTWAITIYVIRILSPEDYGLMGIAMVMIGSAYLFNELGAIPALIQKAEIDDRLTRQVFGFVLITNASLTVVLCLAAPYVADFFGEQELTSIVRVLSLSLLIDAFSAVPSALLRRAIQFKGLSIVRFIAMSTGSLSTLTFAILGYGVWSLVLGNLVDTAVRSAGFLLVSGFRLAPVFRFDGFRNILSFGAKITAVNILGYLNSNLSYILIGKLLGNQALGVFSVAFHLAYLPLSKVMNILNQVAFPAYSRLQNDKDLASRYYLKSVRIGFLVLLPTLWGLSSVSTEFVDVFLGDKWAEAKIILTLLCLIIPLSVMAILHQPLTIGFGRADISLRNGLTYSIIMSLAIVIGTRWGLIGVCVGMVVASPCITVINLRRTLTILNLSYGALISAIMPCAVSAGLMYGAVFYVGTYILADQSPVLRLSIMIVTGVAVYLGSSLAINRSTVRESVELLWAGT